MNIRQYGVCHKLGMFYQHDLCYPCALCPPHPADVPELFTEANEHAQMGKSIKEFMNIARGIKTDPF